MIRKKDGELKEGESIGGFFIKLVVALVAVIIVATIVPDVLGVNVQELGRVDGSILGGITANHCGDASVFLTDAVKTIIGDGYSFLLVGIVVIVMFTIQQCVVVGRLAACETHDCE